MTQEAKNKAATVAEQVETAKVEAPPETLEGLRQALEAEQQKAKEYLDQWRRAAADLSNYRKRAEKEQAEFTQLANAVLIAKLLPVLDDFDRAFQTVPDNLLTFTWVDGVHLIGRKMQYILEQEGVSAIKAEGEKFDPNLHEAVMEEESDKEEGTIIAELQKGYKLKERVLRPALVKVAKAKEQKGTEGNKGNQGKSEGSSSP